jgi:hypothetical protein
MTTTTNGDSGAAVTLPANLPPAFRGMIDHLHELTADVSDALGSSIQIAEAILSAAEGGEEAILAAAEAGTVSGENYIDTPFMVRHDAVQWRPTGEQFVKQGAFPFYALVRTEDEKGAPMVLNIGGQSTVPTLYAMWNSGSLAKYGEDGWPAVLTELTTAAGWKLQKLHKYVPKAKA